MRLTIESTDEFTMIDGVECRIWRGRTDSGRPVDVFIRRVATADSGAAAELLREFPEAPRPIDVSFAEVEARHRRDLSAEN